MDGEKEKLVISTGTVIVATVPVLVVVAVVVAVVVVIVVVVVVIVAAIAASSPGWSGKAGSRFYRSPPPTWRPRSLLYLYFSALPMVYRMNV